MAQLASKDLSRNLYANYAIDFCCPHLILHACVQIFDIKFTAIWNVKFIAIWNVKFLHLNYLLPPSTFIRHTRISRFKLFYL